MSFLAPWAAWFLAGIPIIVLLYLLKLKRRPVTVSTLMFWQRALQESRHRALFQRLRNLLSLLLHLLIFLLIVAALARPTLDGLIRDGASTVLILDTRARMQALDERGDSRFKRAQWLATARTHDAADRRQFAVVGAGAFSEVKVGFTGDEQTLRESVEALRVSDATGDLGASIRLASDLLSARKCERRIVVFTDHAPSATQLLSRIPIEFIALSSRRENVGITRFATRPMLNSPQTSEVLLEVRNFGAEPARGSVELAFDGKVLDIKPFDLAPGARFVEAFPSVPRANRTARGWLTARLGTPDALPADDRAFAVLPLPRQPRVLLVSTGNWFLEKLLAADPSVRFELLTPDGFKLEMAPTFDAVILDGALPGGLNLESLVGNFLFLKNTPFATGEASIDQPLITETDAAHPTLRLVDLRNVTFARATAAAIPKQPADWKFVSPLQALEQPLIITGERRTDRGRQRLAAWSFDLAESDLPLRVAFPLLVSNTLQWLAGETEDSLTAIRAGETTILRQDETVAAEPQTVPALAGGLSDSRPGVFQPVENGFYARQTPAGTTWTAVNTFSDAESDLAPGSANAAPTPSSRVSELALLNSWPLWQYLALAALLLSALEWRLFHRRRTE